MSHDYLPNSEVQKKEKKEKRKKDKNPARKSAHFRACHCSRRASREPERRAGASMHLSIPPTGDRFFFFFQATERRETWRRPTMKGADNEALGGWSVVRAKVTRHVLTPQRDGCIAAITPRGPMGRDGAGKDWGKGKSRG